MELKNEIRKYMAKQTKFDPEIEYGNCRIIYDTLHSEWVTNFTRTNFTGNKYFTYEDAVKIVSLLNAGDRDEMIDFWYNIQMPVPAIAMSNEELLRANEILSEYLSTYDSLDIEDKADKCEKLFVEYLESSFDHFADYVEDYAVYEDQIILHSKIYKEADVDVCKCGRCGTVTLQRTEHNVFRCHECGYMSEPCDFPSLFY